MKFIWLYKLLEKKIQAECKHNYDFKAYLHCDKCNHRHPHWLPLPEEKDEKSSTK